MNPLDASGVPEPGAHPLASGGTVKTHKKKRGVRRRLQSPTRLSEEGRNPIFSRTLAKTLGRHCENTRSETVILSMTWGADVGNRIGANVAQHATCHMRGAVVVTQLGRGPEWAPRAGSTRFYQRRNPPFSLALQAQRLQSIQLGKCPASAWHRSLFSELPLFSGNA